MTPGADGAPWQESTVVWVSDDKTNECHWCQQKFTAFRRRVSSLSLSFSLSLYLVVFVLTLPHVLCSTIVGHVGSYSATTAQSTKSPFPISVTLCLREFVTSVIENYNFTKLQTLGSASQCMNIESFLY